MKIKFLKNFARDYKKNQLHYIALFALILISAFLRVYRTNDLLRFYYDQGRDALVVTKMIEEKRPVLIGPTTGLAGIFRGPFFYYLLLPGYLLTGNPVMAAVWIQLINITGIIFFYLFVKKVSNNNAALLAIFFYGISSHIVDLSRWLSNPSPILTSVPVMLYGLNEIRMGKNQKTWWPIVGFILGINLQLEIASEIWFIPAVLLLVLFSKKFRPNLTLAFKSFMLFFLTLLPQIIFDIRHQGIMRNSILNNFTRTSSPSFSFTYEQMVDRASFYLTTFSNLLFTNFEIITFITLGAIFAIILFNKKNNQNLSWIYSIFLFPLLVLLFYSGNDSNFYSYYLIGTFPIFISLAAIAIEHFFNQKNKPLYLIFLAFFLIPNIKNNYKFLNTNTNHTQEIYFENQVDALDWLKEDLDGREYNLDVYVPPVIPYSYDYLIKWQGKVNNLQLPQEANTSILYTLYEEDPNRPENLNNWLDRQNSFSKVEKESQFGSIVVQKRTRL